MQFRPRYLSCLPAGQARSSRASYLIGVDGGGTGTRLTLADAQGQELARGEAGPSALGQGVAQAWSHVLQALDRACAAAGLAPPALADCAIGLGLSGAGVVAQARDFVDANPGFAAVALDNDGITAVLGAHGGRPGAVLVAGTGSVGEALRADGSRLLVGGWGWINGDEGSGAWLGLRAMRHAQQALDGRQPAGVLARAVWAHAGSERSALLAWCATAGQKGHAGLAPLVFDCARDDAFAAALIDEALVELERLAQALDPEQQLPLVLSGSIALRLQPKLSAALRARCVPAQADAAAGALLMLRQALDGAQS